MVKQYNPIEKIVSLFPDMEPTLVTPIKLALVREQLTLSATHNTEDAAVAAILFLAEEGLLIAKVNKEANSLKIGKVTNG